MTRRIRILPDAVANQIAAGEAVERPASVVKELVENALDARATRVDVAIERGGKRLIRVADDGMGMGREDALLSLDRHATSKIESAQDLASVGTFGFRGEALPSIASVSRMTLETWDGEGEAGTRIAVDGGTIRDVADHARRRGTTVEVRQLFYNAPVRARFLKAVAAETRAVSEAVTALALANPSVAFTVTSDGRTLLELPGAANAATRVADLWGGEARDTLIAAAGDSDRWELRGLIQRPDAAKPGIGRRYLFVNGRPFRSGEVLKAAERGYRTTVGEGVRPWLFLYLRAPKGGVDVNVHPAKAEVRFQDPAAVEALVESATRSALEGEASSATFDSQLAGRAPRVREPGPDSIEDARTDGSPADAERSGTATGGSERVGARLVRDAGEQIALFVSAPDPSSVPTPAAAVGAASPPVGDVARPRLWQVHDTYILAETRDGILIVDQHSAHERVLFQRLMESFERGGEIGQRLLFPLTLRLSPAEVDLVTNLGGLLSRAGFEVEGFGGDTVIVHAVPAPHQYFDAERAFREMVHELTHGSELVRSARSQHERIAMTFACKSAIKAGQRLSDAEMQELFDQLFATELPHHDVHGRPTVVRLSSAELSRKFGRT